MLGMLGSFLIYVILGIWHHILEHGPASDTTLLIFRRLSYLTVVLTVLSALLFLISTYKGW